MVMRPDTHFELVAQAGDGCDFRRIERSFSPSGQAIEAGKLPPGPLDIGESFLGGHAVKVRQEDAQGIVRWTGCHKTFTFVDAGCMVQGNGRKAKCFSGKNSALRRGQSRPMHCIGETYADHFCSPFGCIVGLSLLPLALVASAQSSD